MLSLIIGFQSCSQTDKVVKKSFAFRSVKNAGTVAIDDNGNQISKAIDTVHIVYIESNSNQITWESVGYNGKEYPISFIVAEERPIVIGIDKETGEKLTFNPAEGNTVYKLELISLPDLIIDSEKAGVILKGRIHNTSFKYIVRQMAEVLLPDSY